MHVDSVYIYIYILTQIGGPLNALNISNTSSFLALSTGSETSSEATPPGILTEEEDHFEEMGG